MSWQRLLSLHHHLLQSTSRLIHIGWPLMSVSCSWWRTSSLQTNLRGLSEGDAGGFKVWAGSNAWLVFRQSLQWAAISAAEVILMTSWWRWCIILNYVSSSKSIYSKSSDMQPFDSVVGCSAEHLSLPWPVHQISVKLMLFVRHILCFHIVIAGAKLPKNSVDVFVVFAHTSGCLWSLCSYGRLFLCHCVSSTAEVKHNGKERLR